jgi:hypothetical protein
MQGRSGFDSANAFYSSSFIEDPWAPLLEPAAAAFYKSSFLEDPWRQLLSDDQTAQGASSNELERGSSETRSATQL